MVPTSRTSRLIQTDGQTNHLPLEVSDLLSHVAQLPEPHRAVIEPLANRVLEFTVRRRRIMGMIQEALGQLRLDMKYLLFDLEATRRERDQYRSMLSDDDLV